MIWRPKDWGADGIYIIINPIAERPWVSKNRQTPGV